VAQPQTLAARVRAVGPALAGEEPPVLDQATGLMRYDPDRYAGPRRGASQQYMPALLLLSVCPPDWPEQRKLEVSEMILAALRGFPIDRLTSGNTTGVEAGFEALARALDREEAALVGFHNRVMVFDLRRRGGPPAVMPPAGTH
jgi:hypothetical protein